MICRALEKRSSGEIVLLTKRVNQRMVGHLRTNATYKGKGVWVYAGGESLLLFAIGSYIGLGKKAYIKLALERMVTK